MRDFTLIKYENLLLSLLNEGYQFITFEQYCLADKSTLPNKFIILRHDVDKRAWCSHLTAQMENRFGIQATYYFRVVKCSDNPIIISQIADLGHEIGYHYEDMSICKGNAVLAEQHFAKMLEHFRKYYPVKTICMHGAPTSNWDSKLLWHTADYHTYGIIGEPYYDTDFSDVFYLTDTGRRWDGFRMSVRDKIIQYQDQWNKQGLVYHTTDDIINAAEAKILPNHIMITTHPQRWINKPLLWLYELIRQNVVNIIKRGIIKSSKL